MDYTYVVIIVGLVVIVGFVFLAFGRLVFSVKGSGIKKLFKEKSYSTLIAKLHKELKSNDRNYLAHFYLGETHFAMGNFELALPHYTKVLLIGKYDLDINEFKVRERVADIHLSLGRLKEAQKEFLVILGIRPDDYIYNYRVGDILYRRNYRDASKGYFLKALELNSRHTDSLFRLGQICYEIKRGTEAFNYLKRCLDIDSSYFAACYYMGLIYMDSMNYMHAIAEFDKSIKDMAYRLMSLYQKGKCYFLLGDVGAAVVELERGIFYIKEEDNLSLNLRYLLASAYERKRDLPMAVSQWEIISSTRQGYNDVEGKLEEYRDIRFDDNIKDFMTAPDSKFDELCKRIVGALNLSIIDYASDKGMVSHILALEGESKWRSLRRNKFVVKIYRSNEDISRSVIRDLLENMRLTGSYRGIIVTSGNFSRSALDYASSRPIYLYDKRKLSELLSSSSSSSSSSS